MINNKHTNATKIPSRRVILHSPTPDWKYAHHPSIAFFKGRFYAIWSCGRVTEDDQGQRIMLSRSLDGLLWDTPTVLASPEGLNRPHGVLTAAGLYAHDNALNAYFGYYEYARAHIENGGTRPQDDAHHLGTALYALTTTDGQCWSKPQETELPIVPNHPPQKTNSGRLIISGNISFPYTDDKNGISGFNISGIYGSYFDTLPYCDDSDTIWKVSAHKGWLDKGMLVCEGSFYQTDDNVIHMLLRTNTDRLWCTESRDDGAIWSAPFKTDFETDASKFHFGRLPDGRSYAVGNFCFNGYKRDPLHLCLSRDGESFNTCYVLRDEPYQAVSEDGRKGGLYGYPHTLVHDGYLYAIYSKRKEEIELTRVNINHIK